ncbi:hypothetical protein Q3G72_011402 [Acer saccharum]|nr:hypothetical protein Q3G72_011402 [Acer saccharum]
MGAAQSIVTRSTTSAQAWAKLEVTYANWSNTRKLGLLDSLTNVSLEDKSVADYMQGIKTIIDNLELIGHPVDDGAIVIHTLNGLGSAYMPLASAIRARDTPISFEELYDKLLDHEAYLRRDESKKNGPTITAQFNQRSFNRRGHGQHGNFSPNNGQHQQFGYNNSQHQNHNSGHFSSNNRGVNRNHNSTYHTHNNTYRTHNQSNSAPQNQQWRSQLPHTSTRPICQLCDKIGHTTRTCRSRPPPTAQPWPQANHMTSDQPGSHNANNWILDSGASHHMTSDLQNLSLHSEYGGPENIMLGDGNLYVWPTSSQLRQPTSRVRLHSASVHPVASFPEWHCRLGHPSAQVLQKLIQSHNLPVTKSRSQFSSCSACQCNKSHKLPFGKSTLTSNKPLELLFTDVWGPAHILSFDNFRYYVIFVDYFSKYTWLYPPKHKSDVPHVFKRFRALVENFFNSKIKTVYSDGSGEAQSLGIELKNMGIQYLKSPPHTLEHVGIAERKHRHVVETALTLLHHASVPMTYQILVSSFSNNGLPDKSHAHTSSQQPIAISPPL